MFEIRDGKVWVSSLEIARLFEREHFNVLQAIKNLEVDPNFTEGNFSLSEYKDPTGRSLPMFMMTKKGYRRLVMDFTGKRASEVKEQLLDRFEELEEKEASLLFRHCPVILPTCSSVRRKIINIITYDF